MEGQDVARLATAGDITDSYVEQGLEAELSVDLERKVALATATSDGRGSTLPNTPIGGTGFPTLPARATDRRGEGIASSGAIVVQPTRTTAAFAACAASFGWPCKSSVSVWRFAALYRCDFRKEIAPRFICFGR